MKKLSIFLLVILLVLISPQMLFAQITKDTNPTNIKYDLAYPGILPDNPFYKLKVLRNKISEFLILNPQSKAEFYLLQADKGILASSMLLDKNETKLAEETILKAENNYTLMVLEIKKMSSRPKEKFIARAETAALKHQEIINLLIQRASSSGNKDLFGKVLYFSKSNLATLENYINKHDFQN